MPKKIFEISWEGKLNIDERIVYEALLKKLAFNSHNFIVDAKELVSDSEPNKPPKPTEKRLTPLKAIRLRCLDCSCFIAEDVKKCPLTDCPLYNYRLGEEPDQQPIRKLERDNFKWTTEDLREIVMSNEYRISFSENKINELIDEVNRLREL